MSKLTHSLMLQVFKYCSAIATRAFPHISLTPAEPSQRQGCQILVLKELNHVSTDPKTLVVSSGEVEGVEELRVDLRLVGGQGETVELSEHVAIWIEREAGGVKSSWK
ncbi:hypothetical protein GCK72_004155 [Caenorhabditis remanei]|uniref:Uncharacterized protein n=1 Tax=Caenorhabditis remanei TaxID=31234 RepID=A0A6A5H8Z0_CAERE|nr:hypothetical protein GCK72_004155 [Caenorhabditis remanei]KAF1764208.1 hypothetical protein GCK72_004155 [Caenorhabditis remanei]